MVAALSGCSSPGRPSDQTRHASYERIQSLFTTNQQDVLRQTYVVFSGDEDFQMSTLESKTGEFAETSKSKTINRGLAIGIETDGYLMTAGHVLRAKTFVLGWFDGRIDSRPARVVFRSNFKRPADVVVLKVEGKLNHSAIFSDKPQVGEQVLAVACYYKSGEMGGVIDFAGGTVDGVVEGPTGSSVDLINTDVPLWRGDSGGPLISGDGKLIGIFTEYNYWWRGFRQKWRTTFFKPDKEFIQSLIARDRASANKSPEPTGSSASVQSVTPVAGRTADCRWLSFGR